MHVQSVLLESPSAFLHFYMILHGFLLTLSVVCKNINMEIIQNGYSSLPVIIT